MAKNDNYFKERGVVKTSLGNCFFKVNIKINKTKTTKSVETNTDDEKSILCTLCGNMKQRNIKIIEGDVVDINISIHDTDKGQIVYRYR